MKKVAALLFLLSVAALAAFTPPTPKPPKFTGSVRVAGTVIWVKWTIAASPSDSLTVDLSATNQTAVHRRYVVTSKTDSISYPKPLPGDSISGAILGKNWRAGRFASATATWGPYVEPDTVVNAPTLKGIQVLPASWSLGYGQTKVFCTIRTWSDGHKDLYPIQDTMAVCQAALAQS